MRGRGTRSTPRTPRTPRSEDGSVLVEAAIIVPVLLLLLFAIIDFGAMYNDYLSVRQGTREAARQVAVSTSPVAPSGSWTCPVYGAPTTGDAYALLCYAKDRIGLDASKTRVSIAFTKAPTSPYYLAGNPVVVCAQYPAKSTTGVTAPFLSGKYMTSKVEIRIEQSSTTFTGTVQETPLTGSWPASCTTP